MHRGPFTSIMVGTFASLLISMTTKNVSPALHNASLMFVFFSCLKGSTSTVWKVVDVDTLRVVAVKEMMVCDSKQSAILRHELRVLHPQLQPLIPPKATRGGKKSSSASASARTSASSAGGYSGRGLRGGRGRDSSGGGANGRSGSSVGAERIGQCPYMPRYFGSFVSQDDGERPRVSIVLEHIPGVDLARWIEEAGGGKDGRGRGLPGPVPEAWLARVCRDMLEALRYLHDRRCIHRDVKPANLLLGPEGAKLADFGSTVSEDEGAGHRMHGTIRFMSPERLWARQYRPSSDLWAAGLTVASAALGENPIPHCSTEFEAVEHAEAAFDMVAAHPAASGLSTGLLDFLGTVLVADPDKRPTVEQMLRHPFVLRARGGVGGVGTGGSGETAKRGAEVGGVSGGGGGGGGSGVARMLNLDGRMKRGGGRAGRASRTTGALEGQKVQRQQHHAVAGDGDDAEETWSDDVRETLLRLRRKTIVSVDVTDLIRRVLGARRSRWGHVAGSGIGLKDLDFSPLAAELALSSAELRSLFGSVAANTDGDSSGSWSSPACSSSASPVVTPISTSATSATASGQVNKTYLPLLQSPLPRRRPPPLIFTPTRTSAIPSSAQTAPTSPTVVSSDSLSPVRGRSAGWPRGWTARSRKRGCVATTAPVPDSSGGGGSVAPGGWGAQGGAGTGKESATNVAGGGGWWKGWSQRRRFSLPRLFQMDKIGGGAGIGAAMMVEPRTTELPSPRPDETPSVLSFNTPPLSRFGDEEADGSAASARHESLNPPPLLETTGAVGPAVAAAGLLRGEAAGALGVCDGPAPAWGTAAR